MKIGDTYFSADVETDGPIPGPYSMLSFALVYAGQYDGQTFEKPSKYDQIFYREIKPISENYEVEALNINQLDRERLQREGASPKDAMNDAWDWVMSLAGETKPVLAAYPVSFDWTWLYWYFIAFSDKGSPFGYSRCFDIKTAVSIKANLPFSSAGRSKLPDWLQPEREHTHFAVDDAIEQAEIFAKIAEWKA
ncbi:exonuclease [Rhodovibrio sodomensis]|uniref:Exonuclease n=1 Tax=Rhodovibrio sodomensis TaxID=1088 RepID=A0ABS1DDT0_9PROT|nr:exonuclease [Rhodovibrio sodomensis]